MEKLYNNILLPDNFADAPNDASHVPYLENPPSVIDVTVGRQLFVDDFLIDRTDLTPEYHKAVKYEGNPVLKAETPWEIAHSPVACPKSGGVFYDEKEKLWKMWYEAGWLGQMAYAVSTDGIHWERPDLDPEPGTNKILTFEGFTLDKMQGDLAYLRPDSTTVWIDDDGPAEQRYKLFLRNPGGDYPGIVAVSADGIHFRDFRYTTSVYDRSTMFYNPFRKKWVYSIRAGWKDRSRDYRECDDYLAGADWKREEAHHWMACDELDLPDPYIRMKPQLYNVDCVGYESIMLGMFQIMHGPENNFCEERGVPKITELQPMYSRDGYHFSRPSREAIINASMMKGTWDRGYVQSVGGVCIIHGDELWIYYAGFGGDETHAGEPWFTNGIYRNGATGLAKLRRDGFVSMNGSGTLTTRPLTCTGKETLHINAEGMVKAEILAEDGAVLAASESFTGNSTNAMLQLNGFDVRTLNDTVFRIRFTVDGKLYAFGFADGKGAFGGARAAGAVQ